MTQAQVDPIPAAQDSLFASFQHANPEFSPCPLWWWSGDSLDPERLKWQLERYREGGVWNLVVINLAPSGPLYGHFADDPPFMSEPWWAIFRTVCEHARQLGMRIWFYDQIGFSGANIQGQIIGRNAGFAGETIERITVDVNGAESIQCPTGGSPVFATARRLDDVGQPFGEPESLPIRDGIATWPDAGKTRLSLFYSAPRGFDYFNVEACGVLLDTIHGEFERRAGDYFSDVIVGSFQDELPPMPQWSADFASEFERINGYEILPWLNGLWEDLGGHERRIRHDYHATRAALAERAFFKPLFEWHEQRGLTVGVDQQNPARAGDPKGTVGIYADYLKTHRWFNAPGSDHHGEAKIHSSLAHLYGRRRVWIESFHTSGWGGTIEETFDWLVPWLRAGANLYNPHATYYSTRGSWFEWAPPSTDWRQPYWAHYRTFADAVARLSWLLSTGKHECDVGVVFPTATIQSGLGLDGVASRDAERAHSEYLALVGRMVWFDQQTGTLDSIGIDYDILDDDSIATAVVEDGRLRIAGESYRTIILPSCTVLEQATAEALVEFAELGGEILALGEAPKLVAQSSVPGSLSDGHAGGASSAALPRQGEADRLLERLHAQIIDIDTEELRTRLSRSPALVKAPVPTLVRRIDQATVVFVPGAFPGASRISGWPVASIDFDRSAYSGEMTISVRGVQGIPEQWNPFLGTRTGVAPSRCRETPDGVEVDIPFDGAPCAVLVWGTSEKLAPPNVTAAAQVIAELEEVWDVEIIPTLDNRWGDFTFPASDTSFPVQQWTFDRVGGDYAKPAPAMATFGPRAQWLGPGQPAALAHIAADAPWKIASWSLSRGIYKDPLHKNHLGPAGHVPEEFMDFGFVANGEAVRIRSSFMVDEDAGYVGWFVIGAAAVKRLWIDGREIEIEPDENIRYQTVIPVVLDPGMHSVDILLITRYDLTLRAWMALVSDMEISRRPDILMVEGDSDLETSARFAKTLTIAHEVRSAMLQVGTRGPARISLDDREIGRQGGFLPYGDGSSIQRYDITEFLTTGDHELAVTIKGTATAIRLVIDGVIQTASPLNDQWIMTDPTWIVTRETGPAVAAIDPEPPGDPQLLHLRQRPHPLPGAAWLEGAAADTGIVRPTVWFADPASTTERLRCVVPPGALKAVIPVVGHATAMLDGDLLGEWEGTAGTPWIVSLPGPERMGRVLELSVDTVPGFTVGAVLSGPIEYEVGPGRMPTGDWEQLGLADYSGMVSYRQQVLLPELPLHGSVFLDLGNVRGSAEVNVDGQAVGTCVVAPFRVEITNQLREATGPVNIEIIVANTLGPYQKAVSPTPFVFPGQTVSGLFGPVRITHLPDGQ